MSTFPLSFSRVSAFEQCKAKFEYLYVVKSVKDQGNVYTEAGVKIHEALEAYGKHKVSGTVDAHDVLADKVVGPEEAGWRRLVDLVVAQPGEKLFEFQMAIRRDFIPCAWDDYANVWLRAIGDVVVIGTGVAFIGDWKSGKVKKNPFQLALFAAMIFAHFPTIHTVKTAFIWLAHDDITSETYYRSTLPELWAGLLPRLTAVQEAVDVGVFPPSPSGLCRWCPAKSVCPSARR